MSKFKVGDEVRVVRNAAGLKAKEQYVGNKYKIIHVDYSFGYPRYNIGQSFYVFENEIEPATPNSKILITTDGTTTLARLYEGNKVVKSAEAKCAPSDKFDFATGANLAYDRLMGKVKVEPKPAEPVKEPVKLYCVRDCQIDRCVVKGKIYEQDERGFIRSEHGLCFAESRIRDGHLVPLVNRSAKVGEWIYVTKKIDTSARVEEGEVHQVDEIAYPCFFIKCQRGYNNAKGYLRANIHNECEYLVLDGYKGENQ